MVVIVIISIFIVIIGGSVLIWPVLINNLITPKSIEDVIGTILTISLMLSGLVLTYRQHLHRESDGSIIVYRSTFLANWKQAVFNMTVLPALITSLYTCICENAIRLEILMAAFSIHFLMALSAGFIYAIIIAFIER